MQIFYFARIDCSQYDANTRHVFEFCSQFSKFGHSVTLFVPDLGGHREVEGVSTVYVPVLIRKSAFTFFSFYFFLFFFFLYYYFYLRPDVVYTRHQQMEWMVTWLSCIFPFLYVVEVNGLSAVELKMHSKSEWIIELTRWLEWFLFRIPHRIVVSSVRIRDVLCESYRLNSKHFLVVTNGADPNLFYPMDKNECRKKLGLDLNARYLLFSGSFRKWHGIFSFVKIFPQIKERVPNIRLLLVGDGEERGSLESFIADNHLESQILFFGKRNFNEIPLYINAADICLAPYFDKILDETGISPIKIYEYMACGKPVVSSPRGGLEVLFQKYEVGPLVYSSEALPWIPVIEKLIYDPEKMREYGERGRKAVVAEFNWEMICRKIEKNLQKTLEVNDRPAGSDL